MNNSLSVRPEPVEGQVMFPIGCCLWFDELTTNGKR